MKAKERDALEKGDKILAFNGLYTQHGTVSRKWKDGKGMRWVRYYWFQNERFQNWASKRYLSVYIDTKEVSNA